MEKEKFYDGYLTDVSGVSLGHCENLDSPTGISVAVFKEGATAGVDVRGGAPGTRETDLLKPENLVDKVHSIFLSGGSAYGINASAGIMKYLEEEDIGMDVGVCKVPIVTGAVIFDLAVGSAFIRPDLDMGYRACQNATTNDKSNGLVGAGAGASVGKILGNNYSMKSGLGQASIKVGDLVVSAMTALNAFGDIYDDERKEQIAGVYDRDKNKFLDTQEIYLGKQKDYNAFKGRNTTIALVCTNAKLTKANCNKVSQMAHDGFARSIRPVHTMFDGDTIFTAATGYVEADISLVGMLAAKVISRSIANAIYYSKSYKGLIAFNDKK